MGYGDPMPTRSRSRRRNPDPPQTLTEYREEAFAEALSAAGAHVEHDKFFNTLRVTQGDVFVLMTFKETFIGFELRYGHLWGKPHDRDALKLQACDLLVPLAEQLGEILVFQPVDHQPLPLITPVSGIPFYVFVPSCAKNGLATARAVYGLVYVGSTRKTKTEAQAKIVKALAEARSRDVPKKYRPQVEELFRSAFENDDLGTYLQARELAALVAE
jgi:hypothetical protein